MRGEWPSFHPWFDRVLSLVDQNMKTLLLFESIIHINQRTTISYAVCTPECRLAAGIIKNTFTYILRMRGGMYGDMCLRVVEELVLGLYRSYITV